MSLPCFETERLRLRPRSLADFDACLAMDRDPEVTKFIPGPWHDPAAHERFLRDRIERSLGPGLGYWSIFPKSAPERFLGWILLIPEDGVGPDIEIGWRLVRTAWGQGYAAEAARPVVSHAFAGLGLRRIVADIDARNGGSLRVAEKIGMRLAGQGEHYGVPCHSYELTAAAYRHGAEPARPPAPHALDEGEPNCPDLPAERFRS